MAVKKSKKSVKRGLAAKRKVSPGPKTTELADPLGYTKDLRRMHFDN